MAAIDSEDPEALLLALVRTKNDVTTAIVQSLTMYAFETTEFIIESFLVDKKEDWFEQTSQILGDVLADCMFFDVFYNVAEQMLKHPWKRGYDLKASLISSLKLKDHVCADMMSALYSFSIKTKKDECSSRSPSAS